MSEAHEYPHAIMNVRVANSKNFKECQEIVKDARPGYFEAQVAVTMMLAHAIMELVTTLKECGSSNGQCGDDKQRGDDDKG
jgi:hypothetical protein